MFTLQKIDPSGAGRIGVNGKAWTHRMLNSRMVRRNIGSYFRMACSNVKHNLCDAQWGEFLDKTMRYRVDQVIFASLVRMIAAVRPNLTDHMRHASKNRA
ncbi:hypothetical protein [Trinickia fusca]|uniref:hypothetical protein n=1 Tax=Trinickia fusca TaxID=2419777 RepID=UPI0011C3B54B|nr:hypothetical protein [Trinickia fusca]